MRILVVCPTRDRPEGLQKAYDSMVNTSQTPVMVACIDEDQVDLYEGIEPTDRLIKAYGKRRTVCEIVNRAVENLPEFDIYAMMIDDATYRTPGWDDYLTRTFNEFPNRIGTVSPAHDKGDFLNYPVVSREWIDAVGAFSAFGVHRFTWDTAIEVLGEATNIRYATRDEFYISHRLEERPDAVPVFIADSARFVVWCALERRKMVNKLRAAM